MLRNDSEPFCAVRRGVLAAARTTTALGWNHGFLSNMRRCKMAFRLNYAQMRTGNGSEGSRTLGICDGGTSYF
jgi:hypothetical protein